MALTECRRPENAPRRRAAAYRITSAPSITIQPLPIAGLFAAYTPGSLSTRIDYCEPTTGRCSCGAPSGSCPHIEAAVSMTSEASASLVASRCHRRLIEQKETPVLDTDTSAHDPREVLMTLRALAGLVAQSLRQQAALDNARDNRRALEHARADLLFWRGVLLHHTQRLQPALAGDGGARDYRRFAELLVHEAYMEDQLAIAHHGCDPLTCTHVVHKQG